MTLSTEAQAAARLTARYQEVRRFTAELARPLTAEDCMVQSCPDVSPTKWHLAHTTWFFETFLLKAFVRGYRDFHPRFAFLFNSYYQGVGSMHPRHERGLLSRPTLDEVYSYRNHVDAELACLLEARPSDLWPAIAQRVELGLHHEQQHQELLLMDIKHVFWSNPLRPAYRSTGPLETIEAPPLRMDEHPGGRVEIGHAGDTFCYDNEQPRHARLLRPFAIANRCVSNRDYVQFIEDGGYERHELWLSEGWARIQSDGWHAPLYWQQEQESGEWLEFRLAGLQPIDPNSPVVHTSYFEADAYARWAGARLPSEAEWEVAASSEELEGNFVSTGHLHPRPARDKQFFGDVWELTQSSYSGYPGYRPLEGVLGEYNGKFMSGQVVLRGGSCITAQSHIRPSYRNFFYPHQRWAFQGFRIARDLDPGDGSHEHHGR